MTGLKGCRAVVDKVIIGDCTLYKGDALEILPTIDVCDVVVSDPPYILTYGGPDGSMGGKLSKENYDNKGGIVLTEIDWPDFMPPIYAALKENAHAYFMANNRHVSNAQNAAEDAGFRFHNLLVWDKRSATPNRWYMKNCEFTVFMFKGKAFFINDCGSKQLICAPNVMNAEHPTEKPVEVMANYISNSTQRGGTVLDPFMGGGTTGVAAVKLGRRFVGIEIDRKYFDLSCRRIEDAYKQPDFFRNADLGLNHAAE